MNGAILSDKNIAKMIAKGKLFNTPLKNPDDQIQPNSVDLTLGPWAVVLQSNATINNNRGKTISIIDTHKPISGKRIDFRTDEDGYKYFILDPGQFILGASNEILNIPNGIIGIGCGRSSIARLSIQVEQAGFIDTGFVGSLTLEICNQSRIPIKVYADMKIAQVYFIKGEKADRCYGASRNSKYNGQVLPTISKIFEDVNR